MEPQVIQSPGKAWVPAAKPRSTAAILAWAALVARRRLPLVSWELGAQHGRTVQDMHGYTTYGTYPGIPNVYTPQKVLCFRRAMRSELPFFRPRTETLNNCHTDPHWVQPVVLKVVPESDTHSRLNSGIDFEGCFQMLNTGGQTSSSASWRALRWL